MSMLAAESDTNLAVVGRDKVPALRFGFLDGIRAFAALYVLFHHASQELMYRASSQPLPSRWIAMLRPMEFGHYAVDVFIVLSGFCLMLPVARSRDGDLAGGFGGYLRRRARRILPPYYAAFLISLALVCLRITAFPGRGEPSTATVLDSRVWLPHLLVVQNVVARASGLVDPPLWSVATEWHIYFVFPLLLLPVYRKWGTVASVIAGLATGLALFALFPHATLVAAPWFIGLFAMGMAGAILTVRWEQSEDAPYQSLPWGTVALVITAGFLLVGMGARGWFQSNRWVADIIVGAATFCLIQSLAAAKTASRPSFLMAWLESPLAVAIGAFSYSIYLIHYPLLQLTHTWLVNAHMAPDVRLPTMLIVVPVVVVVLSYLFHLAFERPFMRSRAPRQAVAPQRTVNAES